MRFRNYVNRHNRRNRIYSDEDLLKMTLESIFDNEPSILAQNSEIGIPSYEELEQSPNTEWIDPFTNNEGKQDGGYWQSVLQPDYQETFTGLKTPKIQHGIAGNVQGNDNYQNDWNDVKPEDLDKFLDKDLINNMPDNLHRKGNVNQNNPLLKGSITQSDIIQNNKEDKIIDNIDLKRSSQKTILDKYFGLEIKPAVQKALSKVLPYNDIENEYYRNSLKMKDGEELTDKFKEENDIYTLKDIADPEKSKYYKEQLAKMYGYDVNDPKIDEKLKDKKIVIPKESSRLYQYAKNSEAMEKWVVDNYDKIKNGEKPLDNSIEFSLGGLKGALNNEQRGLFATIHRADINRYNINPDGSFTVFPDDPYNFEKWKEKQNSQNIKEKVQNVVFNRYVNINNRAQEQQDANQLEPFFTSIPIHYTKDEIEEILKRKYKNLYK